MGFSSIVVKSVEELSFIVKVALSPTGGIGGAFELQMTGLRESFESLNSVVIFKSMQGLTQILVSQKTATVPFVSVGVMDINQLINSQNGLNLDDHAQTRSQTRDHNTIRPPRN